MVHSQKEPFVAATKTVRKQHSLNASQEGHRNLTKLINDAANLESEPFGSPKRSQWTDTAQGALERSFGVGSSILDSFGAAQSVVFHKGDSEEALRKIANRNLASTIAILRSGVERLRWEIEGESPAN